MTTEQKLAAFAEYGRKTLEEQRKKTTNEIQEAVKSAVGEAERESRRVMQSHLKMERYRLERESHLQLNAVAMAGKQALAQLRTGQLQALFSALEADLRAFTDTPTYKGYFSWSLEEAGGGFFYVQVMARDIQLMEGFNTALQIEAVEEDFIGGCRLISQNRRKIADYSLQGRMDALRINYVLEF